LSFFFLEINKLVSVKTVNLYLKNGHMTSILWRKYYSHTETENIVKSVLFNYGQGKPIVAIQVGLMGPCVRFNILFAKKCGGIKSNH